MGKEYLGDSVYGEIEHGMIRLTTENGLPTDPSNEIFLEANVLRALVAFVKRETERNPTNGFRNAL